MATVTTMSGPRRAVFSRSEYLADTWNATTSISANTEDLCDVTPLIEARVTDEMAERAWTAVNGKAANTRAVVTEALHAALGITPDTGESA